MKYLLIIEDAGGNLCAYFPDVLGCTTAGGTVEEVRSNALEALSLHLEDEEALPEALSLDQHLREGLELDNTETITWIDYEREPALA